MKTDSVYITIGCKSDTNRQLKDAASRLVACFKDRQKFPHVSVEEAEHQCSPLQRLEAIAGLQLRSLFRCLNYTFTAPHEHQTTADSLLEIGVGGPVVCLQEKASHFDRASSRYQTTLSKYGGSLGRLAYDEDDFDLLVACILHEGDQMQGVFLIPISKLVSMDLVAKRACVLSLYPPWSLPKRAFYKKTAQIIATSRDVTSKISEISIMPPSASQIKPI